MATGRKKSTRAEDDSRDMKAVLDALDAGLTIEDACTKAGVSRVGRLRVLRRKYPDFHQQIRLRRFGMSGETARKPWEDIKEELEIDSFEDKRMEDFLLAFERTGRRSDASKAAKVRLQTVEEWIDPTSKKFNSGFARSMRELELRKLADIEDDAWEKARMGDATHQRFILERRHDGYRQRAKSPTDDNPGKFNPDQLAKSMEALKELLLEIRKTEIPGVPGPESTAPDGRGVGDPVGPAPETPAN